MNTITKPEIDALKSILAEVREPVRLTRAQMKTLAGGVSRSEYCETARDIILNPANNLEGNTGLETVWNICHRYWARH